MRAVHRLGAAAVASLALVSAANATLSVSIVPVGLFPGAIADDPNLASKSSDPNGTGIGFPRTFEIDVTQGAGEKWSFGSLNGVLDFGRYYIPANNSHVGKETVYNNVGLRNLQNDTFVTTPDNGTHVSILGKSDYPVTSPGNAKFPGADASFPTVNNTPDTLDITWGDMQAINSTKANGTYAIARFTTIGLSSGVITGHVGGTQHNFTDVTFSYFIPIPFDYNNDGGGDSGDVNQMFKAFNNIDAYYALHDNPANPGFISTDHADIDNYLLAVGDLNGDGGFDSGETK